MIAKYKFLIISIVLLGIVSFVPLAVRAQDATISDEASQALTESAGLDNQLEPLDEVQVDEVKSIPSGFGFWWRNIREWTSLALTPNPVKKAEKQLKFAEERARLADYIIENSDDPKIQERAQQMLEKANQYMQKIEERKDDLIKKADERSQKLLNNIAKHSLNKERILEKIEDKLPPEKLEKFQQFRQQTETRSKNFLDNLQDNPNIPQEIKDKAIDVLSKVENLQQAREEFRIQQKGILEEIKAGNEDAKKQFEELRQAKQQNMEQFREQFKEQKQEIINKIQDGDQDAIKELKQLNQEQQEDAERIRNVIKQKAVEFKQEIQRQKQEGLQKIQERKQNTEPGKVINPSPSASEQEQEDAE